jgi:integrase
LIATNPARDVRPPKAEKPHARFFDSHALDKLLAALTLQHPRNYALWLLALGVGMRRGEFTALRWDHIRWREGLIIVEQSIEYIAREGEHVKDTKTDAGMRLIPLPEHVRQALEYCLVQQHLDYHAWEARKLRRPHKVTNWRDSDYVFTRSTNGGRLHIEYISTLFQRFLTDHNLPPIGLHSLRHTAISIWRSGGLSDVDAAALAGHESPTTTNIYSHALTEPLRRSATIMDNMLGTKLGTKACASDVSREGTPTR